MLHGFANFSTMLPHIAQLLEQACAALSSAQAASTA